METKLDGGAADMDATIFAELQERAAVNKRKKISGDKNFGFIAEKAWDNRNEYANFHNEYVDTFNIGHLQSTALNTLLELYAESEKAMDDLVSAGYSFDDACRYMMGKGAAQ